MSSWSQTRANQLVVVVFVFVRLFDERMGWKKGSEESEEGSHEANSKEDYLNLQSTINKQFTVKYDKQDTIINNMISFDIMVYPI